MTKGTERGTSMGWLAPNDILRTTWLKAESRDDG